MTLQYIQRQAGHFSILALWQGVHGTQFTIARVFAIRFISAPPTLTHPKRGPVHIAKLAMACKNLTIALENYHGSSSKNRIRMLLLKSASKLLV